MDGIITKKLNKITKTSWKKGQSGNPNGPSKLTYQARAIMVNSRMQLIELYNSCVNLNKPQLIAKLHNPEITIVEESFLRAMVADMERGSTATLERMFERIYGKNVQPVTAMVGFKSLEQMVTESGLNEDTVGN